MVAALRGAFGEINEEGRAEGAAMHAREANPGAVYLRLIRAAIHNKAVGIDRRSFGGFWMQRHAKRYKKKNGQRRSKTEDEQWSLLIHGEHSVCGHLIASTQRIAMDDVVRNGRRAASTLDTQGARFTAERCMAAINVLGAAAAA
jgi:hypothetical protein